MGAGPEPTQETEGREVSDELPGALEQALSVSSTHSVPVVEVDHHTAPPRWDDADAYSDASSWATVEDARADIPELQDGGLGNLWGNVLQAWEAGLPEVDAPSGGQAGDSGCHARLPKQAEGLRDGLYRARGGEASEGAPSTLAAIDSWHTTFGARAAASHILAGRAGA